MKLVGIGCLGGGDHLVLGGIQPSIENVLANSASEQDGLLRHDGHMGSQTLLA